MHIARLIRFILRPFFLWLHRYIDELLLPGGGGTGMADKLAKADYHGAMVRVVRRKPLSLSLSLSLQKTVEWRCHHAIFVLCAVLVGINFAFWRMCKFDCACACHLFILSVHVQLQSFLPLHRHCAVFNAVHCLQLAFPGSFTMPFTSGRVWHRVARD